jgi:hypothetical protein
VALSEPAAAILRQLAEVLIETALAHVIGNQAYCRSDALEKRRKLMEAWASYCETKWDVRFRGAADQLCSS